MTPVRYQRVDVTHRAAADKLRNELLSGALDQWEAEDGPFTQAELEEAASRLGLDGVR